MITHNAEAARQAPTWWLIEINPRSLGVQAADAVESTYGIDYIGLELVAALRNKRRLRALSRPFANRSPFGVNRFSSQWRRAGGLSLAISA